MTDEEWVKQQRPGARLVLRSRYGPSRWRIRAPGWGTYYLGRAWCGTPERAWAAARSRLTHRLLSQMDE